MLQKHILCRKGDICSERFGIHGNMIQCEIVTVIACFLLLIISKSVLFYTLIGVCEYIHLLIRVNTDTAFSQFSVNFHTVFNFFKFPPIQCYSQSSYMYFYYVYTVLNFVAFTALSATCLPSGGKQ